MNLARDWKNLTAAGKAVVVLGLLALIVMLWLFSGGCGRQTKDIMGPAVTVRDTVTTPPCWPPGHCKEQEARDRAAAFKARVVARMAARIAADRRGRAAIQIATVPHGYTGEAFVLRYQGPVDTTIGLVTVDPSVTFNPGVDGEVKTRFCDLVASVYYEVTGDSLANMHGYDYAGSFALIAPNGRIADRLWILEDVCAGARMRGDGPDSAGTYGEAIDCMLESTGETFTVQRNETATGKVGRWQYEASVAVRDLGRSRGVGLRMWWGSSSVTVAFAELRRGVSAGTRPTSPP